MFRTELHRGRRVVAESFSGIVREDPGSTPSDIDNEWTNWYGLTNARVENEAGEALTPILTVVEGWTHGYRFTWSQLLQVQGFAVLGDFIFYVKACVNLGPDTELYLVLPGPGDGEPMSVEDFLASDRVLAVIPPGDKTNFRHKHVPDMARFPDDGVWALRELADSGEIPKYRMDDIADFTDGTVTFTANADKLGAVGGIARLFVPDHGWRWLFPHDDGPAAALAHLQATTPSDDSSVFSSMTFSDDMTDAAKRLITYHDLLHTQEDILALFERLFDDNAEDKPTKWECTNAVSKLEQKAASLYETG